MTDSRLTTAQVDARLCEIFNIDNEIQFNDRICELFMELCEKYDIDGYNGNELEKFVRLFRCMFHYTQVWLYDIDSINEKILAGTFDMDKCLERYKWPTSHAECILVKYLLRGWIENGKTLNKKKVERQVYKWKHHSWAFGKFLQIKIDHHFFDKNVIWYRFDRLQKYYQNDNVRKAFVDLLSEFQKQDLPVYPSGFICAPTGAGKTTFVLHLCCQASPAIYAMVHLDMKDIIATEQSNKDPFHDISHYLNIAASSDLKRYRSIRTFYVGKDEDYPDGLTSYCLYESRDDEYLTFEFVGLIVAIYEELVKQRKEYPTAPWAFLQCCIGKLNYKRLNIIQGLARLEAVKKAFPDMPLTLFMDKCSMNASVYEDGMTEKERDILLHQRLILMRNLARCLKIVIVFVGTDANLFDTLAQKCGSTPIISNGKSDYKIDITAAFYFSDLPAFDELAAQKLIRNFEYSVKKYPRLRLIGEFVRKYASNDIPFLAEKWFSSLPDFHMRDWEANHYKEENLERKFDDYEADPLKTMSKMMSYCQEKIVERFKSSNGLKDTNFQQFNRAQLDYLSGYYEHLICRNDGNIIASSKKNSPTHITNHFARLFVIPAAENKPFGAIKYFSCHNYLHSFTVSSVFTPFDRSPLTGLTLFGISSDHKAFIDEKGKKITVFDAIKEGIKQSNLEELSDCAFMIASRENGPSGCSIYEFLSRFIREIRPSKERHFVVLDCAIALPVKFKIPMLSPMQLSGWPKDLVNLFSQLMPIDTQPFLGYYFHQTAYQSAEPIVLETTTEVHRCITIKKPSGEPVFAFRLFQSIDRVEPNDVMELIEQLINNVDYKDCNLFMLMARKFGNIAGGRAKMMPKLKELKCSLWFLEPKNKSKFTLTPFDVSKVRSGRVYRKTIILLSLEAIWGKSELQVYLSKFS